MSISDLNHDKSKCKEGEYYDTAERSAWDDEDCCSMLGESYCEDDY